MDNQVIENTTFMGPLELAKGYKPKGNCKDEILTPETNVVIPWLVVIVEDCITFIESCDQDNLLTKDEKLALALYTFDLGLRADGTENFYYKLNKSLQERNTNSMLKWRGFLYYFFSALHKIQDSSITVYRGITSELSEIQRNYYGGKKIHWSAFSSTTTDIEVAKRFASNSKIIFAIKILNGKDIQKYSVMKGENEILLHPNMTFFSLRTTQI